MVCEVPHFFHWLAVVDILHGAGAERKQADVMLLCVGKLLLGGADSSYCLIKAGDSGIGDG